MLWLSWKKEERDKSPLLYIIFVAGLLVFIVLYIYLHIAIEGAVVGFVFFFLRKKGSYKLL